MTLPHIRAACVVVQTLREEWDRRAVEGQVTELADLYDHPDVLYACVTIARNLDNRAPVTLTMKAGEIIGRLHAKTATVRTRTGGRRNDQYACDTCGLTRDLCEQQAGNLDGADHLFKTIAAAELEREKQRYVREFPMKRDLGVGQLPADVTQQAHPEPEQESA